MTAPYKKDKGGQTPIVVKKEEGAKPAIIEREPAKKPAPFKRELDEETLKKLRYSGVIYGAAAAFLLFVALNFLFRGSYLNGSLSLLVAALLAALSWQCVRHLIKK